MERYQWAKTIFFILFIIGIIHSVYYYPRLPEQVAIHFGADGRPDGWGSREFFVTFNIVLYVFIYFLFRFIRKVPKEFVNMPHRAYWFAPEREEQTRKDLGFFLDLIGIFTFILILYLDEKIYNLNLQSTGQGMPYFFIAIVLYMALVTGSVIWFYVYFNRIKSDKNSE